MIRVTRMTSEPATLARLSDSEAYLARQVLKDEGKCWAKKDDGTEGLVYQHLLKLYFLPLVNINSGDHAEVCRVVDAVIHKCPTCKGTGMMTIHVLSTGGLPGMKEGPCGISCIDCNGKGELDDAAYQRLKRQKAAEKAFWCVCGNDPRDTHYNPDGTPGAATSKHHWVCNNCGKVTQVG